MIKTKTYQVDGETRVGIWVDNHFEEEVECHSDFPPKEAEEYLRNKYLY